ncbi:CSRN3 protein, partial [Polyodon spathula]|nr:CSRN3 protein [Polyodon spathula]
MSGILKRKFEEVDGSSPCSSVHDSDDEVLSSESADSSDSVNPSTSSHFTPSSILKREKRMRTRNVHFENVTVYYFTRRQGFTSVPSQGGSTLGMSNRHNRVRQYTLGEFALEQERIHREMLRDHLKQEKLNSIKLKLTKNGTVESEEASALTVDDISDDDIDLDNTEVDEYFFLQPLTTKKRRALLRASGVKKIDVEEKHELRAIRVSREDCGCDCRIFCDPETCACSMAGIKCQVDRMTFPCGCTKEGCSNTAGRIEFNPIRVRTHFLHTIMKLELEKNREQQQASTANDDFGEGIAKPAVSHTEVVPLSSVLCYTDGTMIHENHNETSSYYTNSSAEYYQIENPHPAAAAVNSVTNQANEAYNEASSYSERVINNKGTMSLVPYNVTSEQYQDYTSQPGESYGNRQYPAASAVPSVIVCSADQDNSVQCNGVYGQETPDHSQMEFHNYLNNNSQDRYVANGSCFPAEQPKEILAGLSEEAALQENNNNIKKATKLDSVSEATPV